MITTQKTLQELRKRGYVAHVVEKWNAFARIRQDFGNFADILAYKSGENGVLAVQTTSTGNMSDRLKKSQVNPNLSAWLQANNRFVIWGWAKRGPRGKRKVYTLKEYEYSPQSEVIGGTI